jgi:uncharacterized membrane protein YjdF
MSANAVPPMLFTALASAVLVVLGAAGGRREWPLYFLLMALVLPFAGWLHRRMPLSRPLMWSFSAWAVLHLAGGLLPEPRGPAGSVLYNFWLLPDLLRFDHVVHAFGFGTCTALCWHALSPRLAPGPGLAAVCVAFGLGLGALNETVEFLTTRIRPDTQIGGLENTGWDLVANLVGCLTVAAWLHLRQRRSTRRGNFGFPK